MDALKLTDNSKVKFRKNHYNTFGLSFGLPKHGGTCPGATQGAGGCLARLTEGSRNVTCYMDKLVKAWPGVGEVLAHNTDLLRGKTKKQMEAIFIETFRIFVRNNKAKDLYFRINYSGDIFSKAEATALRNAMREFPYIQFWMYTRSHKYVPILCQAANAAVYLSIDPVNRESGYAIYRKLKKKHNVGMAWLDHRNAPSDEKFVTCPATSGRVTSDLDRGACAKCQLCFTYNKQIKLRNITFALH